MEMLHDGQVIVSADAAAAAAPSIRGISRGQDAPASLMKRMRSSLRWPFAEDESDRRWARIVAKAAPEDASFIAAWSSVLAQVGVVVAS